jgi:carotenoid cleavage dioxygenase-like enzyme
VVTGTFGYGEFATAPRRSVVQRLRGLREPPVFGNNASVNVLRLGGRHVAITETPEAVPFDPVTLETLPPITFEDDLPGVITTAHPHLDRTTGSLVNYTVEYGPRSTYHVYELPDDSLVRRPVAAVPTDRPSYMHSFSLTPRYVVLVEYPLVTEVLSLMRGRPFPDATRWRPERGTTFTVVERATGAVVVRSGAPAAFCYHHAGAHEADGAVLVDLPVMDGARAFDGFMLEEMRSTALTARQVAGELRRYRVPLDGGPVTYRLLTTTPLEFPRTLDEDDPGAPPGAVFGVAGRESLSTSAADLLVAVDTGTGGTTAWSQPRCWPGEPVPVSPPAGVAGEPVLLSLVLDAAARRSFLLVLDAATMTEVARATLPHAVPLGFHGQYFPELTGG